MPGLIDAHCHMTYGEAYSEEEIDLYTSVELRTLKAAFNAQKVLRAGVTGISQPGGSYYIGVGLREAIDDGIVQGPRMTSAGRYITTSNGLTDWYPDSVGVPEGSIGVLANTVAEMIRRGPPPGRRTAWTSSSSPTARSVSTRRSPMTS